MRRIGTILIATIGLAAAIAAPASAGSSALGCGTQHYEQPFLRFLDPLQYVLVPGGDFESGAAGWELEGGARVAAGNNPFSIRGGSSSLLIPQGGSATSPVTCVSLLHPTLRFFNDRDGGLLATLKVEMLFTGALGRETAVELLPGGLSTGSWTPTLPLVHLGSALPATSLDGLSAGVRFRFTPRKVLLSGATWRIDDVYVDPYKLI